MSSVRNSRKEGLQVVRLLNTPGKRYELDEAALEKVLLRPDVRDRHVVLVSVAGAYRGGKSFLLDFFLRYLNSSRSKQKNGEWLDIERSRLEGFEWRGGGDRHTTGIHLWPEPILVTLDNGEKVAVLLMDTQGTFDDQSTLGDNSTIFALSTLISSVQIYNISANIREDDLQHLQLFTEYGRLACDGKAFQSLIFLVRDWMHEDDNSYGFDGGDDLLNKRLQPKEDQNKELKEVRDHIRSCFNDIRCFLMPHPGLVVGRKNFEGCVKDLTEEFRMALLELVPALFDHQNLVPKLVSGERMKAKHLFDYFKHYVDIFNSDELPKAITILQATTDACMMSALRDARDLYQESMESKLVEDLSVPMKCIRQWHFDAMDSALTSFKNKKKLGSKESADENYAQLEKELNALLSLYILRNDAKTRDSIEVAKKVYEDAINNVCDVQSKLCLHPCDMDGLHERALEKALQSFDAARNMNGEDDEERNRLQKDLEELYKHLSSMNEQNNLSAVLMSRDVYGLNMKTLLDGAVSSSTLNKNHEIAVKKAIEAFNKHRNIETEETEDPYLDKIVEECEANYEDFKTQNTNSNRVIMQGAEYKYNNFMSSAWGPQSCCFHPSALAELHQTGKEQALRQFSTDRTETSNDDFKQNLEQLIQNRYEELIQINDFNNNQAIEQAFSEYTRRMDKHTQPSLVSILIAPFFVKMVAPTPWMSMALAAAQPVFSASDLFLALPEYHKRSKNAAMEVWRSKRRGGSYSNDSYKDKLETKMEEAFPTYKHPVQAFLRELGIDRN